MSNSIANPKSNTMVSRLRGYDLLDFLEELSKYYLEYRKTINLPKKLTYGIEIEYEDLEQTETNKFINTIIHNSTDSFSHGWISKHDASVSSGGEVTSPAVSDCKHFWKDLKLICEFLKKNNAVMDGDASGHMHYAVSYIGDDMEAWRLYFKDYSAYEHVLFRFFNGDMLCAREQILRFSYPIGHSLKQEMDVIDSMKSIKEFKSIINTERKYQSLNFGHIDFKNPNEFHYKNTLEIRIPNGTYNHIIIQNNLNTGGKMFMSAKKKVIDEEFLDYKLKNEYTSFDENRYRFNEVILKDALEFADINFDNDLDKVYFLKQYLKDFDSGCDKNNRVKPKVFTR